MIMQLRKCLGSAVIAMGPERILALLPISLRADLTCLNIWLIPILKDYVVEASLGYYIENVVPLAKSFERASRKGISSKNTGNLYPLFQFFFNNPLSHCFIEIRVGVVSVSLCACCMCYHFQYLSVVTPFIK